MEPCTALCCIENAAWYERQRLLRKVSRTPLLRWMIAGTPDEAAIIALHVEVS